MSQQNDAPLTFWNHLDVLRSCLWRILVVCVVCGVVAFIAKDILFGIVLAPQHPDFFTYRMLDYLSAWIGGSGGATDFHVELINTGLSQQFVIHMRTAFYAGFLCVPSETSLFISSWISLIPSRMSVRSVQFDAIV